MGRMVFLEGLKRSREKKKLATCSKSGKTFGGSRFRHLGRRQLAGLRVKGGKQSTTR